MNNELKQTKQVYVSSVAPVKYTAAPTQANVAALAPGALGYFLDGDAGIQFFYRTASGATVLSSKYIDKNTYKFASQVVAPGAYKMPVKAITLDPTFNAASQVGTDIVLTVQAFPAGITSFPVQKVAHHVVATGDTASTILNDIAKQLVSAGWENNYKVFLGATATFTEVTATSATIASATSIVIESKPSPYVAAYGGYEMIEVKAMSGNMTPAFNFSTVTPAGFTSTVYANSPVVYQLEADAAAGRNQPVAFEAQNWPLFAQRKMVADPSLAGGYNVVTIIFDKDADWNPMDAGRQRQEIVIASAISLTDLVDDINDLLTAWGLTNI